MRRCRLSFGLLRWSGSHPLSSCVSLVVSPRSQLFSHPTFTEQPPAEGGMMTMLHGVVLLLAAMTVSVSAMVCPPNVCATVRCAAVTAENCVGGRIVEKGGFCGCCDKCVRDLREGERCFSTLVLGVPSNTQCGPGLMCDSITLTCRKTEYLMVVSKGHGMTCADCRLQQIKTGHHLLGQFVPECEADGSYFGRQCHGSVCYCVTSTGFKIDGYETNIGESANMDCKCARDKKAYMDTGLIGKLFYCSSSGNYLHGEPAAAVSVTVPTVWAPCGPAPQASAY